MEKQESQSSKETLLSLTGASGVLVLLFLLARSKSPSEKGHRALNAAKVIL